MENLKATLTRAVYNWLALQEFFGTGLLYRIQDFGVYAPHPPPLPPPHLPSPVNNVIITFPVRTVLAYYCFQELLILPLTNIILNFLRFESNCRFYRMT